MDGRLFGSVTNVDIVEALKAQGFTVEKAAIRMPDGPLKHVGDYPLVVALYLDVDREHHGHRDRRSRRQLISRASQAPRRTATRNAPPPCGASFDPGRP